MKKKILVIFFLLVCQSLSTYAAGPKVQSLLEVYQVKAVETDMGAKEQLVPAKDEVEPGTVLQYVLTFTNSGDAEAHGVVVWNSVPDFAAYRGDSASTLVKAKFEVSIDDGATYEQEPVVRKQIAENGEEQKVVIPPGDYTDIRWVVSESLQPANKQIFTYRVVVE